MGPDNRITDETTAFAPSDRIYASFELEGTGETTMAGEWIHEGGEVVSRSARTATIQGAQVFEFHVAKPSGWAVGEYEVVITQDGREIGRRSFTVQPGS